MSCYYMNQWVLRTLIYIQIFLQMAELADIEHAMLSYVKTFPQYKNEKLSPEKFTDGWAFATILKSAESFKISYAELIQSSEKWTFKLTNLKKILQFIQEYFEDTINKGVKTKDVDLLEIAKNNNIEELIKLFELIVAVVTEAPNKQTHIGTIMSLDQRSQTAFVNIIQNIHDTRILQKNESKEDKLLTIMDQLQTQNSLLRQQVQSILKHNFDIEKENEEFKLKQEDFEQQLQRLRVGPLENASNQREGPIKQKEHLKNLIQNLKEKLLETVRENQQKNSQYRQEIATLQQKVICYNEMEEQLTSLKKIREQEKLSLYRGRSNDPEKERHKRLLIEKEDIIKQLQKKIAQFTQINCGMQEKEVEMKMELQKKEVKCKELQKQVKTEIYSLNSSVDGANLTNPNFNNLGHQLQQQMDNEELEELKAELELIKNKQRDTERENIRMKKNMDKFTNLESEKKKLQRLVIELNKQKVQHVDLILQSLFELYQKGRQGNVFA